MNATPMTKNVGRTVPAVNIGCHAGSLCCLNALSIIIKIDRLLNHEYLMESKKSKVIVFTF